MFPVHIKPGVRFKLNDEIFTILKRLPDLKIEAEDEKFRETKIFTYIEMIKYLSDGQLKFECVGKNLENTPLMKTSFFIENLDDSKYKEFAIFKYEVLRPIIETPVNQRRTAILSRVTEVNSWSDNPLKSKNNLNGCTYYQTISRANVYRWLKDYLDSKGDIRSLFPSYHSCGGKGKIRIDPLVRDFIMESINDVYKQSQRITIKELWFAIINKISDYNRFTTNKLEYPSYSSIVRYITGIPEYELVAKRVGKKTAENKFAEVGDGIKVSRPLERVEIDHTPIDVIIVDENGTPLGRPYLILAIDKFSRLPLGFSIGVSNGVGWGEVMQCIKHIMSDKSYIKEIYPFIENKWIGFGLPRNIVVDNGLEFKNNPMRDASYQLGFIIQFCPPRTPQWKGSIERFFGTANTSLFHNMPGTTRSNPTKLGDDENPSKSAKLNFSTFIALVHKWIVDVYSQDVNKGAGGIPAQIWEKAIEEYPIPWPNSISETAILLGRVARRKITRRGVEMLSLYYNSNELNKVLMQFTKENGGFDEDFLVKYDPQNIGEAYVYDHIITKRWIKAPCTNASYAMNLSEWEHKEMRAYAKKEFGTIDVESLAKAKHFIRKMIENGIGYTEKEIARAKKTTAEQEISTRLTEKKKQESFNPSLTTRNLAATKPSSGNISDIGLNIDPPVTIIPEVFSQQESTSNKIIGLHSNREKGKKPKSESTIKNILSSDVDFTLDDFTGFEINSAIEEATFNE